LMPRFSTRAVASIRRSRVIDPGYEAERRNQYQSVEARTVALISQRRALRGVIDTVFT
jgi:hypothetical protein